MATLLLAARLLLGGLFLYAGAAKLPDMASFAVDVANYRLLPAAAVAPVAAAMVGVELVVAALLLVGRWTRAAALVASGLLVVFILALTQALLRGISLDCGCFGGGEPATWLTVTRDLFYLVPALALLAYAPEGRSTR